MNKTRDPVGKTVRWIERSDDQSGANIRRAGAKVLRDDILARRLERAVIVGNVLVVAIDRRQNRRGFVQTGEAGARICGDRSDEQIARCAVGEK